MAALVDDVLVAQALDTCDPIYRDEVAYVLRLAKLNTRALILTDTDTIQRTKLIYEETIRAHVPPMLVEDALARSPILSRLKAALVTWP
jgi:hypothetical protein